MDNIVENDKIIVRGVGNVAYTVVVTTGHGTLKLKNSVPYLGGWIEVGKVISVIKEGLVLDVPEGDYQAILTRRDCKGEINISIVRDKETVIDCQQLKETKTRTGLVTFSVTPEEAEVYIGGSKLNSKEPVELAYGKYYILVKAQGYNTYGGTMVLQTPQANINISLDKATPGQSGSSSTTSGSGGSSSSGTSSGSSTESSSSMSPSERQSMINSLQQDLQQSMLSLFNND